MDLGDLGRIQVALGDFLKSDLHHEIALYFKSGLHQAPYLHRLLFLRFIGGGEVPIFAPPSLR